MSGSAWPSKLILDDFTAGPWSWTLQFGQSKGKQWFGLDKRHCYFGERLTFTDIVSNPNQTTLTVSIGNHAQRLESPLPVAYSHYVEYGTGGTVLVDLSAVDRFMLDMYAEGGSYLPDTMALSVTDTSNKSGTISWNIRPGGVYFRKSNFPANIDWKHIRYLKLQQDFDSLPNPTIYCATNFYATLKPGAVAPGFSVDPFEVFGRP